MSPLPSCRGLCAALAFLLLAGPGCRKVSQPALDDAEQGLFPVEQDGRWGYINRKGEVVIDPQFGDAHRFFEARALIRRDGKYGFIDPSGTVVIPPQYADAWHFSDGLAPVQRDSLWGFIDPQGEIVIEPKFVLLPSSAGRSRPSSSRHPEIAVGSDRDTTTPVLVPPHFEQAQYFSEERARVWTVDGWGYINREGELVIDPQFAQAWNFRNGLARVRTEDGRMGYVTRTGARVWPPAQ